MYYSHSSDSSTILLRHGQRHRTEDFLLPFTTATFRNFIWIPILISFLNCVNVGSAEAQDILLLPSQRHNDSLPPLSSTCPAPNPNLYYRPVIGILTHPGDGASGRLSNSTSASSIAASYVKFVESAGARVIPLIYNEPSETLLKVCIVDCLLISIGAQMPKEETNGLPPCFFPPKTSGGKQ